MHNIVTHTTIYFIGNLLRRVVSFLMLPIYTKYLTTADYGIVEIFSTILDFVAIIVGMRVAEALFRFYSEYEDLNDKNEVITTGMALVSILNVVGILIVILVSRTLSVLIFNDETLARLLVLYSFTLLGAAFIEIPMAYIRILKRPWVFVAFSTLHLFLQLSLNVYFIVFMDMRIEGVVYSALISTLVTSIALVLYTLKNVKISFSFSKAVKLASFSFPLIITSLISFYIVFGDRYILKYYSDLSDVGIYSLAYKFGFLLSFIVNPFFNYWQSERYEIAKQSNAESTFHNVLLVFSVFLISFATIIAISVEDVLRLIAHPSFWEAHKLVPIILIAYAFDGLTNFTKFGILLEKKTKFLVHANLIAALVISFAYFLLIPKIGSMGAALSTLIAYVVRFWWITSKSQNLYRMRIPWGEILICFSLCVLAYALSRLGPTELLYSSIYNLILCFLLIFCMVVLPILPNTIRYKILNKILPVRA